MVGGLGLRPAGETSISPGIPITETDFPYAFCQKRTSYGIECYLKDIPSAAPRGLIWFDGSPGGARVTFVREFTVNAA